MPDPALCPGHALPLTFPPIDRLPSTTSAAADQTALFGASQVLCSRPTPRLFHGSYASSASYRGPGPPWRLRARRGLPGSVCAPFVRDVAIDPGRASAPRVAVPHILPSTMCTASAPTLSPISWLIPTPHTIAVYAPKKLSGHGPLHALPGASADGV